MRRKLLITAAVLVVLAATVAVVNSSRLWGGRDGDPPLLAHRGIAQTFPLDGVANDTCTASRIHPPDHAYLENTLVSMRAAFAAGADMLEFDVQVSADGRLVVFHDSTLECRTNGRGAVADHPYEYLRGLDLGYGYTADGGATHPLRGTGVGLMPAVEEVVAAFPDRELLLDVKNDDEGAPVAAYLRSLTPERRATMAAYGGDTAMDVIRAELPGFRVASKKIMTDCLVAYLAVGATGVVPGACRHIELHLPARYGRLLWGWPNLFVDRMRAADTRVVLVAGDGPWSEGFDTAQSLAEVPEGWSGWLWTNRVDRIAARR
ncbi:glycerophosphodiester phosphodiesterase family protein [Catenuloplanes atrovinosus]|uniref:Glycerophosphoryl diester phosphodiesterase n=1 Tax=Catenuloplanes atrovinosus TaxID=137266 RepID=A0AAE3YST2_9ACTN|nr:glycerophosphodiester phosphodiesterase family protein [Catenuloplanes atrovinosus]MDR7277788.1 glycerophosphoryl diester phosphodiesterase [Catenuloplanes atrovinosus]